MLRFLKALFRGKHPLRLAALSGNPARYRQALIESELVVIHAELGEGLPFNAPEEAVLRMVEKAASVEPAEARFFTYEDEGRTHFPFFLTVLDAANFCGAYSGRENRLYAYQLMEIQGAAIIQWSRQFDNLVMNAQGDDEFKPGNEFISALRELPSSNESTVRMRRLEVCLPHPSIKI